MGNSSVNGPFSRAMLNSQRVYVPDFLRISHNMYTREISISGYLSCGSW